MTLDDLFLAFHEEVDRLGNTSLRNSAQMMCRRDSCEQEWDEWTNVVVFGPFFPGTFMATAHLMLPMMTALRLYWTAKNHGIPAAVLWKLANG